MKKTYLLILKYLPERQATTGTFPGMETLVRAIFVTSFCLAKVGTGTWHFETISITFERQWTCPAENPINPCRTTVHHSWVRQQLSQGPCPNTVMCHSLANPHNQSKGNPTHPSTTYIPHHSRQVCTAHTGDSPWTCNSSSQGGLHSRAPGDISYKDCSFRTAKGT